VIVERAPAAELIPRPLEMLERTIADGLPRGTWSRATEPAIVLGSGQRPPEGWRPPDGVAVVRRGTGGGAVICDADYLMLDIALPGRDARVLDDLTESYRWLASVVRRALLTLGFEGLTWVEPPALRALDLPSREAGRTACFAGLGPYELLDRDGRKLVGLAQRRRGGAMLLQAAAYLAGARAALADMLWLDEPARDDIRARLERTAVLGPVGLRLPEQLGPVWQA
jgi:lipoate-protein ligase A